MVELGVQNATPEKLEKILSNERETVRKHECKKKHVKKSIYGKLPNPYDLNKAPGFNKNG